MLQQKQRTSHGSWMIKPLSLHKQGSSLRISRYSIWLLCVFTAANVLASNRYASNSYATLSVSPIPVLGK